jgi:hypothetical protein
MKEQETNNQTLDDRVMAQSCSVLVAAFPVAACWRVSRQEVLNQCAALLRARLRTGVHMAYSLITGAQATGVNRTTILRAKDLIGLLLGHFSGSRRAAPRCRIALRVFTPSGMPAVKIRCQ